MIAHGEWGRGGEREQESAHAEAHEFVDERGRGREKGREGRKEGRDVYEHSVDTELLTIYHPFKIF